jgi:hypothetical protein
MVLVWFHSQLFEGIGYCTIQPGVNQHDNVNIQITKPVTSGIALDLLFSVNTHDFRKTTFQASGSRTKTEAFFDE